MVHVLDLQDELLVDILKLAVPPPAQTNWHTPDPPYEHKAMLPIIYTCRCFSRLAIPLLYHSLDFRHRFDCVPIPKAIRCLQSTLQTNPLLGQFVRRLSLRIDSYDTTSYVTTELDKTVQGDFSDLKQLCSALPNVKFLEILGGFSRMGHYTGDLMQTCAQYMPLLEDATLFQDKGRPYVGTLVKYLQSSSLKRLQVVGHGQRSYSVERVEGENLSNVTSFSLIDYDDSVNAISKLIKEMSTALEEFRWDTPYFYDRDGMSLRAVGKMLHKHRGSLKTLNLGYMMQGANISRGTLIDLSRFTALQHLIMSRAHFGLRRRRGLRDWDKKWADLLLAPNFKTLTLDYEMPEGRGFLAQQPDDTYWENFKEEDKEWWRNFAQEAVARKSSLREIRIVYNPTFYALDFDDDTYRWDRIDKLMDEFGPHGLKFTYDKPDLSRSDWHNMVYGWANILD